jgi:hypothetical protein
MTQQTDTKSSMATTSDNSAAKLAPFKVARVEKTGAPDGSEGQDWYR